MYYMVHVRNYNPLHVLCYAITPDPMSMVAAKHAQRRRGIVVTVCPIKAGVC